MAVVQVFEGTTGISPTGTKARFLGKGLEVKISEEMLGRIMSPLGDPLDGGPPIIKGEKRDGYRARIRNHGHSCFLCEIVIRSQFHTTYEPEA
jgi:Archaeal/vacuolar-type H+-ATPase subunit B